MPYTPHQVTQMLDLPASSLRRLSGEFAGYLSKSPGRHRRYNESDIAILRFIRSRTGQGARLEDIKKELTLNPLPTPSAEDTLSLVPSISTELERLDTAYNALYSDLERLRREFDEQRQQDRSRIDALEQWARLPWYRRLFTPPPRG